MSRPSSCGCTSNTTAAGLTDGIEWRRDESGYETSSSLTAGRRGCQSNRCNERPLTGVGTVVNTDEVDVVYGPQDLFRNVGVGDALRYQQAREVAGFRSVGPGSFSAF